MYDSTKDTEDHREKVTNLIDSVCDRLLIRAETHDLSKLSEPEKSGFDSCSEQLRELQFMSPEYKECLDKMKPILEHHYANSRHHPQHFEHGIDDMTLIDLIEMLCDWKASTERMDRGDIRKSVGLNSTRFHITTQLENVLRNTVDEMNW